MRIILDTKGGDSGAEAFVKGAVKAMEELDIDIVLVGDEKELSELVRKEDPEKLYEKNISILNAPQVVEMTDNPLTVIKEKPDSSMASAIRFLEEGHGDALVSAGNTGALLAQSTLILKRIKGIRRAALAPLIPTAKGAALLIDCGANAECTPEYLLQFALMGSFYAKNALKIKKPRVALLNNGTEETKGDTLRCETYKLLKDAANAGKINFIGNVEARGVPLGEADVIVADGFSGNVLLKAMEGIGLVFKSELKKMFLSSVKGKIAASLVKDKIAHFKNKIDYNELGGAPLLGIRRPVIKAHGSANARAIYCTIIQVMEYIDSGMTIKIGESIKAGEENDE